MAFNFNTGTASNVTSTGNTTFGFNNQASNNPFGQPFNNLTTTGQSTGTNVFGVAPSVNNGNSMFGTMSTQNANGIVINSNIQKNNSSNNDNNNNNNSNRIFRNASNPFFNMSQSSSLTGAGSDFTSQTNHGFGGNGKTNTVRSNDTNNQRFIRPQTSSSSGQISSIYHDTSIKSKSKFRAASAGFVLPKSIDEFISSLNKSFSNLEPIDHFCGAYLITQNPRYISELQMTLDNNSSNCYSTKIEATFENSQLSNVNNFVSFYIKLISEFQFESILNSIDLILAYFNQLIVFFNNNDAISPCIQTLVLKEINFVCNLSMKCDKVLYQYSITKSFPIISNLSGLLSKLFNNCKKNLLRNHVKKSLLLKVSNIMLAIFFKIDQPLNSNTIFITNHLNFKTLKGSDFEILDLIKYRYYLGKYLMINSLFQLSLIQFKECYRNFPVSSMESKNFENILENLVVLLIINGYKPKQELINQFSDVYKRNLYFEILKSIRTGNVFQFRLIIDANGEYLRAKELYTIVYKNCLVICYRNLFLKVFRILNADTLPHSYNNIIDYNSLLVALNITDPKEDFSLLQVEELLVSLIEKKWIKGIIFTSSHKLLVSKKNDCFPPMVSTIDYSKNEYDWLDKK